MTVEQLVFINPHRREIVRPNALPLVLSVGLTGGIASGKSTVARELEALGAGLVDLDVIAHSLTMPFGTAMPLIAERFGEAVLSSDGSLNREVMRELVFNEPDCKTALENIIHPLIFKAACELAHELAASNPAFIIYDVPLLAQSPLWQSVLDYIVVVDCPVVERAKRLRKRNPNLSDGMIKRIMSSQATYEQLRGLANVIVDNGQHEANHLQLKRQANILFQNLITL